MTISGLTNLVEQELGHLSLSDPNSTQLLHGDIELWVFLTSVYCAFPTFNKDSDLFLKTQIAVTTCMITSLWYFIVS